MTTAGTAPPRHPDAELAVQLGRPAWRLDPRTEHEMDRLLRRVEKQGGDGEPWTDATLANLWRGVREEQGR